MTRDLGIFFATLALFAGGLCGTYAITGWLGVSNARYTCVAQTCHAACFHSTTRYTDPSDRSCDHCIAACEETS